MTSQEPIHIQVLNSVHCVVLNKQGYRLYPALSYETEFWIQGRHRKERKTRRAIIAEKISGKFPTGLLGRVKAYCKKFGIPYNIEYPADERSLVLGTNVVLPFKLRDYQEEAVSTALFYKRGVIQAPTGSGKTFMMASIAAYFPYQKITIFLVTKTLLIQTLAELKKFFPDEDIGQIGEGKREYKPRISVAMIQTVNSDLKSQIPEKYKLAALWAQKLDVVFVDECHHVNKFDGSFARVLSTTMAPARFGVTATMPPTDEGKLALEAFVGPVIYEVKMDTLIEAGSLATPVLKLIRAPEYQELKREASKYPQVYDLGIVHNRARNRRILALADTLVNDNRTTLIIISRRDHGENLLSLANRLYPKLKITYVHGDTEAIDREEVRQALIKKQFNVVIASTIWKEGVDIPTLGAIINAAGGKSEIATIQSLGRGLRTAPGKDEILFYDLFDNSHYYLISHFGERLTLYFDLGWL